MYPSSSDLQSHVTSASELSHASSQGGASSGTLGMAAILTTSPLDQLSQARDILQHGLDNINYARRTVALTDGMTIADVGWAKVQILYTFNILI